MHSQAGRRKQVTASFDSLSKLLHQSFCALHHLLGNDIRNLTRYRAVQHMLSGAVAGIAEHIAMYPADTLKTRMQALGHPGQQVGPFHLA